MSGFKQKCTQFLISFSGIVFHALSHGVIRFLRSVSPRNHFLTGGNSLTANQKLLLGWISKLTRRAKWIVSCERPWKTLQENGVRSCVHFCFSSLLLLERCVLWIVIVCLFVCVKVMNSPLCIYSWPLARFELWPFSNWWLMQAYQIDAFTNADQLSQTGHASNGLAMYSSTTDIPGAASGRLPPQANVGHYQSCM